LGDDLWESRERKAKEGKRKRGGVISGGKGGGKLPMPRLVGQGHEGKEGKEKKKKKGREVHMGGWGG